MTHSLPMESLACSAFPPKCKFTSAHTGFCFSSRVSRGSHAGLAQCLSNLFMGVLSLLLRCKWDLASYCISWRLEHVITLSVWAAFSRSRIRVSRLDSSEGKDLALPSSNPPHVLLESRALNRGKWLRKWIMNREYGSWTTGWYLLLLGVIIPELRVQPPHTAPEM